MKKLLLMSVLLLALPFAAAEIETYNADFTVSLGRVFVEEQIMLSQNGNFAFDLPEDAAQINLAVDGKSKQYSANIFGKSISVSYFTEAFLERNNFLTELVYPDKIKNLSVKVVLPANSVLEAPYSEETAGSNSIFPKPTQLTTDGQHIIIIWKRENLDKGDSLPILVKFKEKADYTYLIYILIILIIAIVAVAWRIISRKPKTIVRKEDQLEKHLKGDEEQIVNILKQRENQCEQGTLRVITGFSKAKLSGLLKELEDRKIIHKELRGKKNLVFLKK